MKFKKENLQHLVKEKLEMAEKPVAPTKELVELRKLIMEQQEKLMTQHQTITQLQQENKWLSESFDNVTSGYEEISDLYEKQHREFSHSQKQLLSLQSNFDQLHSNNERLLKMKKEKEEENEQLKRQMQEENEQLQQKKRESEQLNLYCQQKEQEIVQLHQTQQQLEDTLRVKQDEVGSLQGRITAIEQSWKVNYKEVTLTKQELGRGGWGVIWIGEFRGQKVAVKQMHELIVSPEFLQLLNREINIMAQLRHPNLLQFIGAVLDHPSGNPMIITEIMDISLRGAYEKKQLSPVPVSICLSIMRDVAVGLNYLHCLPDPIIHRDVSSANVLLESKGLGKWKTKISDFGSAKFARSAVTKAAGAEVYSAPEALQAVIEFEEEKQTPKMDVYSYGILLCEVVTCQFPERQLFRGMLQKVRTQSQPLYGLVASCIKKDPQDRPTMKQVIQQLDRLLH